MRGFAPPLYLSSFPNASILGFFGYSVTQLQFNDFKWLCVTEV